MANVPHNVQRLKIHHRHWMKHILCIIFCHNTIYNNIILRFARLSVRISISANTQRIASTKFYTYLIRGFTDCPMVPKFAQYGRIVAIMLNINPWFSTNPYNSIHCPKLRQSTLVQCSDTFMSQVSFTFLHQSERVYTYAYRTHIKSALLMALHRLTNSSHTIRLTLFWLLRERNCASFFEWYRLKHLWMPSNAY